MIRLWVPRDLGYDTPGLNMRVHPTPEGAPASMLDLQCIHSTLHIHAHVHVHAHVHGTQKHLSHATEPSLATPCRRRCRTGVIELRAHVIDGSALIWLPHSPLLSHIVRCFELVSLTSPPAQQMVELGCSAKLDRMFSPSRHSWLTHSHCIRRNERNFHPALASTNPCHSTAWADSTV